MIRTGAPSLVMTGGMALAFRLDRLLLGVAYGPQAVAVYALAASFAELPRIIPAAFGQLANSDSAQATSRVSLTRYLLPSAALTALAAIATGAVGIAVMKHIDPTYRESIAPLCVLLLAELALVPYSIAIRAIMGGGRIDLSARVGLVGLVLSAALYWILITQHGVMGAAWASLIVYASVSSSSLFVHFQQKARAVK